MFFVSFSWGVLLICGLTELLSNKSRVNHSDNLVAVEPIYLYSAANSQQNMLPA